MVPASFSPLDVKRVGGTLSPHTVTHPCQSAFPEPVGLGIRRQFHKAAWWLVANG